MNANENEIKAETKETGRLEAFSDGVIAVAITLLALEIKVPPLDEGSTLLQRLAEQWPIYLAFLLSFATIGIMWINHHRLFTLIKRVDHNFLILNTLLLMGITLVPFTSALVGEYIGHDGEEIAAMIYSGMFLVIAIFFNLLWWYAARQHWLDLSGDQLRMVKITNRQYRFSPFYYLIALLIAPYSVPLSIGMNIVFAIFYALPAEVVRHLIFREEI
jgi:TMEM175 potassium channel family protein